MSDSSVTVLCVVAHPDDAEIALGGAIATWTDADTRVVVAICSTSEPAPMLIARRRAAAEEAAVVLGHQVVWLVPDDPLQVENIAEYRLVGLLDAVVRETGADVIVTHSDVDSHADHRRVAGAVLASSRTWPEVALLCLEVSEHRTAAFAQFQPNFLAPMAGALNRRREALRAYNYDGKGYRDIDIDGSELRSRALGSLCAVEAAEPLKVVRVVAGTRGGRGLAHLLQLPREL